MGQRWRKIGSELGTSAVFSLMTLDCGEIRRTKRKTLPLPLSEIFRFIWCNFSSNLWLLTNVPYYAANYQVQPIKNLGFSAIQGYSFDLTQYIIATFNIAIYQCTFSNFHVPI